MRLLVDDAVQVRSQIGVMKKVLDDPFRTRNLLQRFAEVDREYGYNAAMAEIGIIDSKRARDDERIAARIEQVEAIMARMIEKLGGG